MLLADCIAEFYATGKKTKSQVQYLKTDLNYLSKWLGARHDAPTVEQLDRETFRAYIFFLSDKFKGDLNKISCRLVGVRKFFAFASERGFSTIPLSCFNVRVALDLPHPKFPALRSEDDKLLAGFVTHCATKLSESTVAKYRRRIARWMRATAGKRDKKGALEIYLATLPDAVVREKNLSTLRAFMRWQAAAGHGVDWLNENKPSALPSQEPERRKLEAWAPLMEKVEEPIPPADKQGPQYLLYVFEKYICRQKRNGVVPASIKWTRSKLNNFVKHANNQGKDGLSNESIDRFLKEVLACTMEGRRGYWRAIRAFLRWSSMAGELPGPYLVDYNPRFPKPAQIIAPLRHQIETLLGSIPKTAYADHRDRCYFHFLYYTGVRLNEALRIKRADLDMTRGYVNIFMSKTNAYRVVPLADALLPELNSWLKRNDSQWLFPACFKDRSRSTGATFMSNVQSRWRDIQKRAGYPCGGRVNVHMLRHCFGMHARQAGLDLVDIKDLMGHASLISTQAYAVSAPELMRERVNRIWAVQP